MDKNEILDWQDEHTPAYQALRDAQDKEEFRTEQLFKASIRLRHKMLQAQKDMLAFYQLCYADDRGEDIVIKWFHAEWRDLLIHNNFVLIKAPRGTTKTTVIAGVAPLWFLGHDPNLRIGLLCGNDSQAGKRLGSIKQHIKGNPMYHMVFPDVTLDNELKNDALNLNVKRDRRSKDYTVQARGILSDGTGDRVDILIVDDICNYKNTIQEPGLRDKVSSKFRGEWLPTINPRDGRCWCIYTPWHPEDSNARLERETDGQWAYRRYHHGSATDMYHSIFPELFSADYLKQKHNELGTMEYSKSYLTLIRDDTTQVVHPEWLNTIDRTDLNQHILNTSTVVISIDPTGGKKSDLAKKTDPDYVGITVILIAIDPPPTAGRPKTPFRIYVVDNYQVRLSTSQASHHIARLHTKWQADAICIEAQGSVDLHSWVIEDYPHLMGVVHPIPAQISKKQRLESVTPLLESPEQRVLFAPKTIQAKPEPFTIFIPKPIPANERAERPLRSQMLNFPTKHDDALDSFTQALRFARSTIIPQDLFGDDYDPADDPTVTSIETDFKVVQF